MEYTLIRSKRKTLSMELRDGEVIVRAPLRVSKKSIDAFVESHTDWLYRQKAKQQKRNEETAALRPLTEEELAALFKQAQAYFPQRVKHYASLMGVEYGRVTIRCQKTRWGSCSLKKNLNFNFLLMLTSEEVRDSVIVHELCHLKEMNHSKRFYEEVEKVLPDYKRYDRWLKENAHLILGRLEGSGKKQL